MIEEVGMLEECEGGVEQCSQILPLSDIIMRTERKGVMGKVRV